MRKVILKMHVSLDGYIRAADGDVMDWVFDSYDDELKQHEIESLWQAGTHIMGRNLYLEMADYWPDSDEEYAEPMNSIPKVVFSQSLERADWHNSHIASGDLIDEIEQLQQQPGNYILAHGGAEFAQSLARADLIDFYQLIVHPVVLGSGLALFVDPIDLTLIDTRVFPCGSILLNYGRA